MNKILYYVTTNSGKFEEVKRFLSVHVPSIELAQASLDIEEMQSLDQKEIAIDKAKKAWGILQKPLLLDDAGIFFERYHQFPGTLTKFVWDGIGFEGIKRLIDKGDPVYFLLTMVYVDGPDSVHTFEGKLSGTLTLPEKFNGNPKLPFDEFVVPDGQTCNYFETKKNFDLFEQYSYRIRALKAFLLWYKAQ